MATKRKRSSAPLDPERTFVAERGTRIVKGALLGRGTFGRVYAAANADGTPIALKEHIKDEDIKHTEDHGISRTTLREISLLRRLEHPHIIVLRGLLVDESNVCSLLERMSFSLLAYRKKFAAGAGPPVWTLATAVSERTRDAVDADDDHAVLDPHFTHADPRPLRSGGSLDADGREFARYLADLSLLDQRSSTEFAVDDLAEACVTLARDARRMTLARRESACVAHLRALHKRAMAAGQDEETIYDGILRAYAELLGRRERSQAKIVVDAVGYARMVPF